VFQGGYQVHRQLHVFFPFLEMRKQLDQADQKNEMLLGTCKRANFTTVRQFKNSAKKYF
jgi:hypothetical protein